EILDDDDYFGARIGELVLELARRVERVDVDHRAPGAQRPEHADRILQDVRHHYRNASALAAAVGLQIGAKGGGQRVQLAERDGLPHARVRGTRRVSRDAVVEYFAHRRVFVNVDLGRDAFRITLEPDPLHERPPTSRDGARAEDAGGGM